MKKNIIKILAGLTSLSCVALVSVLVTLSFTKNNDDQKVSAASVVVTPVVEVASEPTLDQTMYITKAELEGYRDEYLTKTDEVSKNVLDQLERLVSLATYSDGEYIERSEYTWVKDQEQQWAASYNLAANNVPDYTTIFDIAFTRMVELNGEYFKLANGSTTQVEIAQNAYDFSYRYGIHVKSSTIFNQKETKETMIWINTDLNPDSLSCSKDWTAENYMTYDLNTMTRTAEDTFWKSNGLTMDDETYLLIDSNIMDLNQPIKPMQIIGFSENPTVAYAVDYKVVRSEFIPNSETGEDRWVGDTEIGICRVIFGIDGQVLALFMKQYF